MPRREQYVPKHRGAAPEAALTGGLKKSVMVSGVAVAATGIAVSSGIVVNQDAHTDTASAALASAMAGGHRNYDATARAALADRSVSLSRSDERTSVDETKATLLDQQSGGQTTKTEDLSSQDPRTIAKALLPSFGFDSSQFTCLDELYMQESGWNVHADNPTSSAYGIPQALPGSKMASAGSDWQNNAETQIRWGLQYIKASYGTPCGAEAHERAYRWY
ncbi:MAG: lytic transglycosylase domain-containing protein [Nocardioidaceae bacterium]